MCFFYISELITFRLNYDSFDMNVSTHVKAALVRQNLFHPKSNFPDKIKYIAFVESSRRQHENLSKPKKKKTKAVKEPKQQNKKTKCCCPTAVCAGVCSHLTQNVRRLKVLFNMSGRRLSSLP